MNKRGAADVLARLREQRSHVAQSFLWVLFGLVGLGFLADLALSGFAAFSFTTAGPTLIFAALIGAALWLNSQHRLRVAAWLITGVLLVVGVLGVLSSGLSSNAVEELLIFFVPLTLSGLLLNRIGLWVTTGVTLLAVLATAAFSGGQVSGGDSTVRDSWAVALQFGAIFTAVALLLDRFGMMLRDTLDTALQKELQLSQTTVESRRTREALLERQKLDEAVLENLPGIFYVIDQNGRYIQWNRNLLQTMGYTQHEMRRINALEQFVEEDRELITESIIEVFERGYSTAQATAVTKEGRRIPYFLNGSRVMLDGKPYLAGIGIDRTEIDAANERVRALNADLIERLERLRALREIDMAITGHLELDPALDVILDQVTERLQVDAAAILLHRPETRSLYFAAGHGFSRPPDFPPEIPMGEGLAGHAAQARELTVVNGADAFAARFKRFKHVEHEGFSSYVAVPLVSKGRLQGVLELFHRSHLDVTGDWAEFLTTLATQTALALDNGAMFEYLQRSNAELRRAYDTTIEGWGRALDLRDEETAGHSIRVTELTLELARRMGVPEEELTNMRWGALLHDIGKMGIPDRILLKPGRLTEQEFAIMQQHTVFAYEFLTPIPFLKDAIDIPYSHHERWDGSGYPQGLKGEEIPLPARIFAVVDVYDALTSDRPYRPAWSAEQALEHIRAGAGRHFDPDVTEVFLKLMQNDQG